MQESKLAGLVAVITGASSGIGRAVAMNLAEAGVRLLLTARREGGSLVNMSSVMATKVRPTAGAYAGTKYAIEALSEAFRMELAGTGVQVISVEPGLVSTELHDRWPVHPSRSMNIPNPLKPEDVARCVRFALTQPENVRIPRLMILPHEHQI